MSMNTYGGQVTGCVIKKEYFDDFIRRYIECNPEQFKDCDAPEEAMEEWLSCNESFRRSDAESEKDVFYALTYNDDVYYNTAAIYHLTDLGEWHEELDMPFILVEADRTLLSKNVLEGKYYSSKEEIINEFRSKLGRYLPDDFDYEGSIGDVEYAIFC